MTLTVEENTQLMKFKAQYLQLLDPGTLCWPRHATLKKVDVQAWLFKNLFDKQTLQYLPNDRYQARVLKIALARIEESIEDPDQDVSAITSNLCTQSSCIGLAPPVKTMLILKSQCLFLFLPRSASSSYYRPFHSVSPRALGLSLLRTADPFTQPALVV